MQHPSSTEQMLHGIPLQDFVATHVHTALDAPRPKMRRFVWYFQDEPTEGVLCSNGHVLQDVCAWRELYHFSSWHEFEKKCVPEYILWIDPEEPDVVAS